MRGKGRGRGRWISLLLAMAMLLAQLSGISAAAEEAQAQAATAQAQIVLTLGADLSEEQKSYVMQYLGIAGTEVKTITITNADEKSQLGNLISEEQIGSHTLSCALIRLTTQGGIQVKAANMNYVTSNMIASTLSTSGVYNCEVLTAAPFEVSGTGALTGVMMAYEAASGETLDPEKKALANEELVITGEIADTVGQSQATLVVNDIKIHIVRDQVAGEEEVKEVVDNVVAVTEVAAQQAADIQGTAAPEKLGEVEHEKLYNLGNKFSAMKYEYKDMQRTLERVTHNVTQETGIDDPLEDTFETLGEDILDPNSILLNTEDSVLGEDAIINATNNVALGDHPAEPIDVYTGDVTLTESGGVKAEGFISRTNAIPYKDMNGHYAMMDLNGNLLTDSVYTDYFNGQDGFVEASLDDGTQTKGVLDARGEVAIPFQYPDVEILGEQWGAGIALKEGGTEEDHDYSDYNGGYFMIDHVDIYFLGDETYPLVGTLSREQFGYTETMGSYLNVEDRTGVVTTYDSAFTAVRTAEYTSDFGELDEDDALCSLLEEATGKYVSSFKGNYARMCDYNTGKYGIMDRYGNEIVPAMFESLDYNYYGDSYVSGGYFAGKLDGGFAYVTAGGTVTAQFAYPYENVMNYGMAAIYKAEDGSITLLSADGTETALGTKYEYFQGIREANGKFWIGESASGKDLLDWRGNVLLSGSDNYSLSANGNYLIAQNGYTSSMLYLVDDASPVGISDSVGGASELEVSVEEGASLEAYTGEPQLAEAGAAAGSDFVDGTHLIYAEDGGYRALFDLTGKQLTEAQYDEFTYKDGWLLTSTDGKKGILSMEGSPVLPCEYDEVEILNENWALAYKLVPGGTEDDYDFKNFYTDELLLIDTVAVCHLSPEEVASVELTREQFADADAEEDYINIMDRTTQLVNTYDAEFNAIAAVGSTFDFDEVSKRRVLAAQLQDQTGYYVEYDFVDGYTKISRSMEDYSSRYGVADMEGNVVVPPDYDRITSYDDGNDTRLWANGYFAFENGDTTFGFVTQGGAVTCEVTDIPEGDYAYQQGMAAYYKKADGSFTLFAADGTITDGFAERPRGFGRGLFWATSGDSGSNLIDWHGNVLFENVAHMDVSYDDRYILVQETYDSEPQLYTVDGAAVEGVSTAGAAAGGKEDESEAAAAKEETDETEAAQTEAAETEAVKDEAGKTDAAGSDAAKDDADETEAAAKSETDAKDAAQTEAAETDAAKDEAGEGGSAAAGILASAQSLVDADIEANSASILVLLQQAQTVLKSENPDAAMIIGSAVTLLEAGGADAATITTLMNSALEML